jgi:hypothetical protein
MVMCAKAERSLVTHEEFEILSQTHHPAILDLDENAISAAQQRIRDLRGKERTLVREMRRGIRGKAAPRGTSFPGNVEKPSRRKQIFSGALKRLNKETTRRHALAAREALADSSRRALAFKSAEGSPHHPSPGSSSHAGMNPVESGRQRTKVSRAKVGRVSQATKAAQAAKDARDS